MGVSSYSTTSVFFGSKYVALAVHVAIPSLSTQLSSNDSDDDVASNAMQIVMLIAILATVAGLIRSLRRQ